jgi:hypothetical protein
MKSGADPHAHQSHTSPKQSQEGAEENLQEFDFRSMVADGTTTNPYTDSISASLSGKKHESRGGAQNGGSSSEKTDHQSRLLDPQDLLQDGERATKNADFSQAQGKRVDVMDYALEHKSFVHYQENELLKLSAIIKGLREDREKLIQKMEYFVEEKQQAETQKKQAEALAEELKIELTVLKQQQQEEFERSQYQMKLLISKKDMMLEQNKKMKEELEGLHKKQYVDVRKIRERELDLENKLELLKTDAQAQLLTREQKLTDLKRHIDNLEFEREVFLKNELVFKEQNKVLEQKLQRVLNTLSNGLDFLQVPEYDAQKNRLIKKVKL